jgi:hypothetical protein
LGQVAARFGNKLDGHVHSFNSHLIHVHGTALLPEPNEITIIFEGIDEERALFVAFIVIFAVLGVFMHFCDAYNADHTYHHGELHDRR